MKNIIGKPHFSLELFRYAIFALFYLFCVWMVLAHLKSASPAILSAGILSIAVILILSWFNILLSLGCFIILIPLVSGLYQMGFLPVNPLSFWFAVIYLSWFVKRVFWDKKRIVINSGIESAIDLLSAIVLLSLAFTVFHFPVDYVGYRMWGCICTQQSDPMFCVFAAFFILQGLFLFRVVALEANEREVLKKFNMVFYFHAITIFIFSFIQLIFNIPKIRMSFIRLNSPFDDIHSYGSYVVLLFFAFLVLTFDEEKLRRKIINGCFAGVLLALVVLSWSRTAWLSCLIVFSIFVYTKLNVRNRILLILSALVLFLFINMNPSILKKYSNNPYVSRFSRTVIIKSYEKDINVESRVFLCKRALDIIQTYPITGSGVGTFYRISPFYGEETPRWKWPEGRENAHNYYAQFCADLGVPAFLLFLGIIVGAYRKGFRGLSLYEESGLKNLLKGLMFGLSAYLITMIGGHPLLLSSQRFLFWFAIAVISINYQLANSAEERASG